MTQAAIQKSTYIPLVTDVVVPGDPEKIKLAKENLNNKQGDAAVNFQRRIDEVESAIGQDEVKSPSRAHAIRAEFSS